MTHPVSYASKIAKQVSDTFKSQRKDIEFEFEGVRYTMRPKDCSRLIVGAWSYDTGISKGVEPKLDEDGERVGPGEYEREYPTVEHDGRRRLTDDDPLTTHGLLVEERSKQGWDQSREINDLGIRLAVFLFDGLVGREVFTYADCQAHFMLLEQHDADREEDLRRRREEGWGTLTDTQGTLVGGETKTCYSAADFAWFGDQIAALRANPRPGLFARIFRRNA